jgi:signal transduction histidine kinase
MLERMRWRLTLGYASIFALILVLLGTIAVIGFSRELAIQQDTLLTQEAKDQTSNLLEGEHREVLAEGSAEYSWVALDTDGRVTDRDPSAKTLGTLGLPDDRLAERALEEGKAVFATTRGPQGSVRVVSTLMRGERGEVVGVIQYARSLRGVRETLYRLLSVMLPLGIGGLGLAILGGRFMAGRALSPVRDSFERQRTFIADASHELKTPLTLIRADAEMVLYRDSLNEQDRKLMEHALGETDRMGEVLSDLLLVARLDAGKLEVARKPFDLVGVLKEEAERFGPRAAGKDVRLEVEASGELPILGDTRRTAQILAVLLDSAVRFAPPGGSILVRGRLRDRWAEVSVTDTGPGITLQHLSRVFDRFYRAESARTRGETGGGSGLGLSIARDLARVQGGDITAEGTEGRGATFRLRLPKGEALTRARDP